MKYILILLFLFIPAFVMQADGVEKSKAQEIYEQANNALKDGKKFRAIELYTKAIKMDPRHVDAYINRAMVFTGMGRLDEALADCSKAIELNPAYMLAYANRGRIYQNKKQHDKAVEDFKKAIELNPKYYVNYLSLVISQLPLNDMDGAIETYTKGIEQISEDNIKEALVFRVERAQLYMIKKDYDNALEDINFIIKASPDSSEAYNKRGVIYKEKGMNDKALADYSKAIELNPKSLAAYMNRTTLYKEMGEYEKSLADCLKVIELASKADEYKKMADELRELIRGNKTEDK